MLHIGRDKIQVQIDPGIDRPRYRQIDRYIDKKKVFIGKKMHLQQNQGKFPKMKLGCNHRD